MRSAVLIPLLVFLAATYAGAAEVKSFCAFGEGTALQLKGGAVWYQEWGKRPWDWFVCEANPNVNFLNKNVTGLLKTALLGFQAPEDGILTLPFAGTLVLAAGGEHGKCAGQIVADITGDFVIHLDKPVPLLEEGIILIPFGQPVWKALEEMRPDATLEVVETSGKFKSIEAVGRWEWYVSGHLMVRLEIPPDCEENDIYCAIAYSITQALIEAKEGPVDPDNPYLLGAEEQIVLAGKYKRRRQPH